MTEDEFTPRDRGLLLGHQWAAQFATTDEEVRQVADGDIPAGLRAVVEENIPDHLDVFGDPDAEDAFWAGFIHGARAFYIQVRFGGSPN